MLTFLLCALFIWALLASLASVMLFLLLMAAARVQGQLKQELTEALSRKRSSPFFSPTVSDRVH